MRKEVKLTNFTVYDVMREIRTFLTRTQIYTIVENVTNYYPSGGYGSVRSSYVYMVLQNMVENKYLIFFSLDNGYISLVVSTSYNYLENVLWQQDVVHNGKMKLFKSDKSGDKSWVNNFYTLHPAPTIFTNDDETTECDLVMNHDKETCTTMISCISRKEMSYEAYDDEHCADCTTNMFFGTMTKMCDIDGGFFYGGDFVVTYELVHRSQVTKVQVPKQPTKYIAKYLYSDIYMVLDALHKDMMWHVQWYSGHYSQTLAWIDNPEKNEDCRLFGSARPNMNTLFNVEVFLFASVDTALVRDAGDMIGDDKAEISPVILDGDMSQHQSQLKNMKRSNVWCTTLELEYYPRLVTTLTIKDASKLPTYWPMYCRTIIDTGKDVNTLNGITLALPMYFMVMRDPIDLKLYSCVGVSEPLRYINMYNMSTNHMKNGNYPIETNKYNCFQTGIRRNMMGLLGYNGIAFRQEVEDS